MSIENYLNGDIKYTPRLIEAISGFEQLLSHRGQCFFSDFTEEDYDRIEHEIMMTVNGWVIPIEMKNQFIELPLSQRPKEYYRTVEFFHDFEGSGKWLYRIEEWDNEK